MSIATAFDEFVTAISLNPSRHERIATTRDHITDYLADDYEVVEQGSWANGTAVTAADPTGEYDLDLVAVHNDPDEDADDALDALRAVLADNGNFRKRLEPKGGLRCIRLRYATSDEGRFHVDLVVARGSGAAPQLRAEPLDVALYGRGWKHSNPQGYTNWCADQGEGFARAVRMLKRWRDVHQDARSAIKSIVLQVLTGEALARNPGDGTDAGRIVAALEEIRDYLAVHPDRAPEVYNPALLEENLTEGWQDQDYQRFYVEVTAAADLARQAYAAGDPATAHDKWRQLFGRDFPPHLDDDQRTSPPGPLPGLSSVKQQAPRQNTERYG